MAWGRRRVPHPGRRGSRQAVQERGLRSRHPRVLGLQTKTKGSHLEAPGEGDPRLGQRDVGRARVLLGVRAGSRYQLEAGRSPVRASDPGGLGSGKWGAGLQILDTDAATRGPKWPCHRLQRPRPAERLTACPPPCPARTDPPPCPPPPPPRPHCPGAQPCVWASETRLTTSSGTRP